MKNTLIVLFSLIVGGMQAQITQVGTYSTRTLAVHTLLAGPKLLSITQPWGPSTDVVLLNPDLTVYRNIPLPALAPGYSYSGYPIYFSNALFDLDTSNFEFVIATVDTNYQHGCRVFREDGTVLFSTNDGQVASYAGANEMDSYTMMYSTPNGTYWSLWTTSGSVHYLLPGQLPCVDCSGVSLATGGTQHVERVPIRIAPNPSAAQVTLELEEIDALGATLVVTASDGKVVRHMVLNERGKVVLDVQDLASDTYLVSLVTRSGRKHTGRFVVVR